MSYSAEFRKQVLAACDAGGGTREVAVHFEVSESWVRRIKQQRRESGKTAPCKTRKRIPKWQQEADRIQELVEAWPDLTLGELKEELGTDLSESTLCRALQRLKLTLKKSPESSRAGSAGRRPETRRVDRLTSGFESGSTRIPRRNLGKNQHDASAWSRTAR